jgi:UDP-glucose 4-epimerase
MAGQKTAVVTGGAGFVGSHLCERLVRDGWRVISLDNYFAGSKDNHVAGVEYRQGHTKDIAQLVPEVPDIVYHLGEYSRVHKSLEEPALVWDLNTAGTQAILEFWREKKCRLLYAASSTKTESPNIAPYTWAKAANVELINNYGKWYGLPYATVYFYNVYGPRERAWGNFGTVVETFRQNYLAGKPHQVNAPGTQTRAFTHVLDTVEGIVLAGEKGAGDGYTISSEDVHSIREVAELFGGPVELQSQTKTSRSAGAEDASQIKALGWQQQHTLKGYIEEVKKAKQ